MVGENVISRQWIAEPMLFAEAGESSQILGAGPQGVVSDAALIAARIDEGGVVEMAHAELLKWCSGSSAWDFQCLEIVRQSGSDNGPSLSLHWVKEIAGSHHGYESLLTSGSRNVIGQAGGADR